MKVVANGEIALRLALERQLVDDKHAIAWAASKIYCGHIVRRQHLPSTPGLLVTVVALGWGGWLKN